MRRMFDKNDSLEEILTLGKRFFITTGKEGQGIEGDYKYIKERIYLKGRSADILIRDDEIAIRPTSAQYWTTIKFPTFIKLANMGTAFKSSINGETEISGGTTNAPITINETLIEGLHELLMESITNQKPLSMVDIKLVIKNSETITRTSFMKLESYELGNNNTILLRFISTNFTENYRELAEITLEEGGEASGVYNRLSL